MKKILVLTGSPRKNGNTDKLAEAFEKGAKAAGHEVFRFDAGRKNIGGCHACNGCWSNNHACCRKDDFWELEPLLESCDGLAIITPLYSLGFTAQIKAPIDKLYAYGPYRRSGGGRPLAIKESCFLVCGEMETETGGYEMIKEIYRQIAAYKKWRDRGSLVAGGFGQGGIEESDILAKAEEMGRNF